MSIYATVHTVGDGPRKARTGLPREYAGSHVYPKDDAPTWEIQLAAIPSWCVPGHDEADNGEAAPWLRLSVGPAYASDEHVDVVLDEGAVRSLRDGLDRWLAGDKVRPTWSPA